MQRLRITHLTEYRFASPVTLLPHRLLLRPREGHDVHIETSKLDIAPSHTVKWHRDCSTTPWRWSAFSSRPRP